MKIKYDVILQKLREEDTVSNVTVSNVQVTGYCTAAETVGDVVYINSSGDFRSADASSINTAKAVGVILSKPTTTTCTVIIAGLVTGLTGLTMGQHYFLSETVGQITATAPITSGAVIVQIGQAQSATSIIVNISNVYTIRS